VTDPAGNPADFPTRPPHSPKKLCAQLDTHYQVLIERDEDSDSGEYRQYGATHDAVTELEAGSSIEGKGGAGVSIYMGVFNILPVKKSSGTLYADQPAAKISAPECSVAFFLRAGCLLNMPSSATTFSQLHVEGVFECFGFVFMAIGQTGGQDFIYCDNNIVFGQNTRIDVRWGVADSGAVDLKYEWLLFNSSKENAINMMPNIILPTCEYMTVSSRLDPVDSRWIDVYRSE
jgi:hypothetical protein